MVATDAWGQRSHYLRWQRTSKHLLDDIKLFYPGLTDLKVLQGKARKGGSEDLPHLQSCHTPWVCSKMWWLGGWQSDFHCGTGGGRKFDL